VLAGHENYDFTYK